MDKEIKSSLDSVEKKLNKEKKELISKDKVRDAKCEKAEKLAKKKK